MLCLVTNPTIDRQIRTTSVVLGSVSRSTHDSSVPGGKPANVARAALAVGVKARLLALLPDQGASWYLARLEEQGLACRSVGFPGVVRQTVILFELGGRTTVINGQGATVPPGAWQHFCEQAANSARTGEWTVISGSFPPSVDRHQVDQLVTALRQVGSQIAVDTGPAWLGWLLDHKPDLVTPNLAEAHAFLTGDKATEQVETGSQALPRAALAAHQLTAAGAKRAVVTAGRAGVAWVEPGRQGQIAGLDVPVASPIGAGDAFLGGLVGQLESGTDFPQAVYWGMAAASSAIGQWVPGMAQAAATEKWHAVVTERDKTT